MGLAVDYGAHITHYFMTTDGADRNKRVETTLIDMGPAVLNGGFSTFLAFILLQSTVVQLSTHFHSTQSTVKANI